jgi:hypothetical protein
MYIKEAIQNILEKNLDEMKNNFQAALTEKAIQQLEERKIQIAQSYFAEERGQSPGSKASKPRSPAEEGMRAAEEDDDEREEYKKKGKKIPARLTGELARKFMAGKKK